MTDQQAKMMYQYFSNVRGLRSVCISCWHQVVVEVHAGNVLLYRIPHNERCKPV